MDVSAGASQNVYELIPRPAARSKHKLRENIMTNISGSSANPNQALWEKGDFTQIAAFMRQSGEAIAESLGITLQMKVLDLGCGDGTTAGPLARLGADVVGIDIAR